MIVNVQPDPDPRVTQVRECLKRILASPQFERSDRSRRMLEFLVEMALSGQSSDLKESVIGVGVFDRDAGYDPKADPVVRVTAGRLRTKLEEYYAREEVSDPIRIEIPKGAYVPNFVPVTRAKPETVAAGTRKRMRRGWVALAAMALVAAGVLVSVSGRQTAPSLDGVKPFATGRGSPTHPSFSPAGDIVAFEWTGPGDNNTSIYLQRLEASSPGRLSRDIAHESWPVWSPDGRQVAFVREVAPDRVGIFSVPLVGSGERKWFEVSKARGERPRLDWSPDGKWFATADRTQGPSRIVVYSTVTGERRTLTETPANWRGDSEPVFSPDSSEIAFRRTRPGSGDEDIFIVPLAGGRPRQVTFDATNVAALVYTRDRGILFSSRRGGSVRSLWWMPRGGGTPKLLSSPALDVGSPAVSRDGQHIAFVKVLYDSDIWQVSAAGGEAALLTSSEFPDSSPQFSPDGRKVAFVSSRAGAPDVWVADASGANAVRITDSGGQQVSVCSWSPDGSKIAYEWRARGKEGIYIVSSTGGAYRALATGGRESAPRWSRDGRFLYINSHRSGTQQIWRIPAEGGQAVPITTNGGSAAAQTEDGSRIYYGKSSAPGIWSMPLKDGLPAGEETQLPVPLIPQDWGNWALGRKGIYFVHRRRGTGDPAIEYFDFATKSTRVIYAMPKLPVWNAPGLALSPHEQSIAFAQVDRDGASIFAR